MRHPIRRDKIAADTFLDGRSVLDYWGYLDDLFRNHQIQNILAKGENLGDGEIQWYAEYSDNWDNYENLSDRDRESVNNEIKAFLHEIPELANTLTLSDDQEDKKASKIIREIKGPPDFSYVCLMDKRPTIAGWGIRDCDRVPKGEEQPDIFKIIRPDDLPEKTEPPKDLENRIIEKREPNSGRKDEKDPPDKPNENFERRPQFLRSGLPWAISALLGVVVLVLLVLLYKQPGQIDAIRKRPPGDQYKITDNPPVVNPPGSTNENEAEKVLCLPQNPTNQRPVRPTEVQSPDSPTRGFNGKIYLQSDARDVREWSIMFPGQSEKQTEEYLKRFYLQYPGVLS